MTESQEKIRIEIQKALDGKPHIFRTDKNRQAIDGCSAGVMANFDEVVKTQNRDDITKYSKTRNESYLAII